MGFDKRVFRTMLDAKILALINNLKTQNRTIRNMRNNVLNFVTQNAPIYMEALTEEERTEIETVNTQILAILNYIDANLPTTIKLE